MIRQTLTLFFVLVCLFGTAVPSYAHSGSYGYSTLHVEGKEIVYELFLDQNDYLLQFDTNLSRNVENEELSPQRDWITSYLKNGIQIIANSQPLQMELSSMKIEDKNSMRGILFELRFTSEQMLEQIDLHYNLVYENDPEHKNMLVVMADKYSYQDLLSKDKKDIHLTVPTKATSILLWNYFVLGIEHILTGYDHLLFLLSLILIASRFKDALIIVTAFTVAHSITLFLVATGTINVNSAWVEVTIALTICYVALENLFVQKAKWRWLLTAMFGLIHGMGFAGAVAETGLPKRNLIGTLLSFNIGVEAGQLMVLCVVLPLLLALRKYTWYRKLMISTSCIIFMMALYWVVQRLGS